MKRWLTTVSLTALALVSVWMLPTGSDGDDRRVDEDVPPRLADVAKADGAPALPPVEALPLEVTEPSPVLFDPDVPKAPRRVPVRPRHFTHPPPGGPLQYEAVTAARRRDCSAAMAAVQKGMEISVDHATLFRGAWLCFDEAHQRKLAQGQSNDWDDFASRQLEHFEGAVELWDNAAWANPELLRSPHYLRSPLGGIEYRMWQYVRDEQMADIVHDLIGAEKVADTLAADLYLESEAALGFARLHPDDQTSEVVEAWARRVFILGWALRRRPGRMIDEHRPEMLAHLRDALDEASLPRDGRSVPRQVREARKLGGGL